MATEPRRMSWGAAPAAGSRSTGAMRPRRPDDGATTVGWLPMVAAVAGLAALAVALVISVVNDTSEQIGDSDPRRTAALLDAAEVVREAETADAANDPRFNAGDEWETYFTNKCSRIAITHSGAGITATPQFTDVDNDGYDAGKDTATCTIA